jgi:hypothetical protein
MCPETSSPSKLYEYCLHCKVSFPLRQARQLGWIDLFLSTSATPFNLGVYLAVLWVHAGQIDLGCEGDLRRYVGVAWAAVDLDTINAVLVNALQSLVNEVSLCTAQAGDAYVWWAEDGAVPI